MKHVMLSTHGVVIQQTSWTKQVSLGIPKWRCKYMYMQLLVLKRIDMRLVDKCKWRLVTMILLFPLCDVGRGGRLVQVVRLRNRTSSASVYLHVAMLYLCISVQCEDRCLFLVQSRTSVFLYNKVEFELDNSSHGVFSVEINQLEQVSEYSAVSSDTCFL